MLFLIFAGAVALVFGVALLVSPQSVRKLSEHYSKVIVIFEKIVYNEHIGIGISSILVSVLCFFVAYYLGKKY